MKTWYYPVINARTAFSFAIVQHLPMPHVEQVVRLVACALRRCGRLLMCRSLK